MRAIIFVVGITLSVGLFGCAAKTPIPSSSVVPAASGITKVTTDANNNSKVELKVQNLAPPQNLVPPKSVYVVWVETRDNQKFNLGQLKVDKNLNGELNGTTPFKEFRLIVTAEDFATVTQPSTSVILTTDVLSAK
ncbi:MAG: hypothetical protein PHH28_16190 [Desulfuromonadaceae bacterium]|nr:hypothetical protein [Desulfuromonadaceae bacterium]